MPDEDRAGAESSTASQDSTAASSTAAAPGGDQKTGQDSTAASSTATAEPKSIAGAMEQAIAVMNKAAEARNKPNGDDKGEGSPAHEGSGKDGAKPQGEGADAQQQQAGSDGKPAGDAEGEEKLSPKAEQRFKELTGKLKQAEPKVRNWDRLQGWCESAGFENAEQFSSFLNAGRLINLDPLKAIPVLERTLEECRRRVGETDELPPDIQKRLADGYIDDATARELARERARNLYQSRLSEQDRQRGEVDRQRREAEGRVTAIADAITKAEKAWKASDPDYEKLQPFVLDRVTADLTRNGHTIRTEEDAVKLFQDAVKIVKNGAGTLRGPQKEITPKQGGAGGSGAAPKPKNVLEAMEQAHRQLQSS